MKNLGKNKNIYAIKNYLYVEQKNNGVRHRRSTGLKKCPFAFKFIKKHFDEFISCSKSELLELQTMYRELEDEKVMKRLRRLDKPLKQRSFSKNKHTFENVISTILYEKSFLKQNTKDLYKYASVVILDFLRIRKIRYLRDFERSNSIDFVNYCKQRGLKDSSIALYCSIFKRIFNYAVDNDLIVKNVFFMPRFKQKMVSNDDDTFVPLSLDEIETIIKKCSDEKVRLYLVLAFFTGARTGELLALTYEDLDFVNKKIRINKSISSDGIIDSPKTKSSNRVIDMLDLVLDEFADVTIGNPTDRIFNLSRYKVRSVFKSLQRELGFKSIRKLYETRHSFASIMLSCGEEPMWVGCEMMGHKDLNETYRSYARFLPNQKKERASFLKKINLKSDN